MWLAVVSILISCHLNGINGRSRSAMDVVCKGVNENSNNLLKIDGEKVKIQNVTFLGLATGNWSAKLNLTMCNKLSDCFFLGIDLDAGLNNSVRVRRVWRQTLLAEYILHRTHPAIVGAMKDNRLELKLYAASREGPLFALNGAEIQIRDVFFCGDCVIQLLRLQTAQYRIEQVCYGDEKPASTEPEYHRLHLGECEDIEQESSSKTYKFVNFGSFDQNRLMVFRGTITSIGWSVRLKLLLCTSRNVSELSDCHFVGFDVISEPKNTKNVDYRAWKQDPVTGQISNRMLHQFRGIWDKEPQFEVTISKGNDQNVLTFNGVTLLLENLLGNNDSVIQFVNMHSEKYRLTESCYMKNDVLSEWHRLNYSQCKDMTQNTTDKTYQFGFDARKGYFGQNRQILFNGRVMSDAWSFKLTVSARTYTREGFADYLLFTFYFVGNSHSKNIYFHAVKRNQATRKKIGTAKFSIQDTRANNTLDVKLWNANNFLRMNLSNIGLPWTHLTYCKNCFIEYVKFDVEKYELGKVCYENETGSLEEFFEYHEIQFGECIALNQDSRDKTHRFGTNGTIATDNAISLHGVTNQTWSVELFLPVCILRSNQFTDDCFFLVFTARPSQNRKDIDCHVSKVKSTGELLESSDQTFYDAMYNDNLLIELFNLNNFIQIVFNNLVIRPSGLIYCENCIIQFVSVYLEGYQLDQACHRENDGRLRLPPTSLVLGRCSYKNTRNSLKDVSLPAGPLYTYELSYNFILTQNWDFNISMFSGLSQRSNLALRLSPKNDTVMWTRLNFVDKSGKTRSLGYKIMAIEPKDFGGLSGISVSIMYLRNRYEFFVNGQNSLLSFDGSVFDRFIAHTRNTFVEHVCLKTRSISAQSVYGVPEVRDLGP